MRTKSENPVHLLEGESPPDLLRFYFELNHLKGLYRQGWLRGGVEESRCETVAEHSFATAVLALVLAAASPALDAGRVLELALVHDLGEIYLGDITPADGIEPLEKSRLEAEAVRRVVENIPGGERILGLWLEFEAGESPEARFVCQIDRLEMGLQAGIYSLQGENGMGEFFASASQALSDEPLVFLLEEMREIASNGGSIE
jgi:putative hydrolase of HD superfamily